MADTPSLSHRPLLIASIMLATFMVAIEGTIVATAMPSIVGQLGGFSLFSWVFSAFLLAQTLTTVVYGKLADLYGRKPTLVAGTVLFLIGSLACGFARSMPSLIGFRLLQGLGAGAIPPVTMTLIGDLYKIEARGRAQGMIASVWAVSAVLGPLAGGLIVANIPWAWIFWINLPIGVLAVIGFTRYLHESIEPHPVSIDFVGAALFAVAIGALMLMLTVPDAGIGTLGPLALVVVAASALFLLQERRAPEPIVSLELWTRRLIATSNAANLLAGAAIIGLTSVLPIYVQGVLGRTPIVAGFTLTMLVLGWPLSVILSGRLYRRFGIRRTLICGSLMFPMGASLLLLLTERSQPGLAAVGSFLMGCGMGLISITSIALVQDSVPWAMRGSATASTVFARTLGNTVGATALGAVLKLGIAHFGAGGSAAEVHDLLNRRSGLTTLALHPDARAIFDRALHWSFWGVTVMAVLTCVMVWLIPVGTQSGSEATSTANHTRT
jgi:EmrB/QacA subfamily drug resistance transporter